MQKLHIEIATSFAFSTEIPITINYINYGGHMGNSAYLDIAHEARLRYLAHLKMSEMDFEGKSLIMGNVAINFKKEVFHGDRLIVKILATNFTKLSFDLMYEYFKVEKDSPLETVSVAVIKTGMICFDYETRKVSPIPDYALEQLSKKDANEN